MLPLFTERASALAANADYSACECSAIPAGRGVDIECHVVATRPSRCNFSSGSLSYPAVPSTSHPQASDTTPLVGPPAVQVNVGRGFVLWTGSRVDRRSRLCAVGANRCLYGHDDTHPFTSPTISRALLSTNFDTASIAGSPTAEGNNSAIIFAGAVSRANTNAGSGHGQIS